MIISVEEVSDGVYLITDNKSPMTLYMEYEPEPIQFEFCLRRTEDGDVEPKGRLARQQGEEAETFKDRALAFAQRLYIGIVQELIEAQSRADIARHKLGLIRDQISMIESHLDHGEFDNPTDEDLASLQLALNTLQTARVHLSEAG